MGRTSGRFTNSEPGLTATYEPPYSTRAWPASTAGNCAEARSWSEAPTTLPSRWATTSMSGKLRMRTGSPAGTPPSSAASQPVGYVSGATGLLLAEAPLEDACAWDCGPAGSLATERSAELDEGLPEACPAPCPGELHAPSASRQNANASNQAQQPSIRPQNGSARFFIDPAPTGRWRRRRPR